jgi:hypothetical protein
MKDRGAPTANHTNHPMMIIKESIPLTTVSTPGSFHLKLQHQQWSLAGWVLLAICEQAAARSCPHQKAALTPTVEMYQKFM